MFCERVQRLGQPLIIDFQFKLLVQAVEHFVIDAVMPRFRVAGHGATQLKLVKLYAVVKASDVGLYQRTAL